MGKPLKHSLQLAGRTPQQVIGQHSRQGDGQTCSRHDQGFTHRPGQLSDIDLTAARQRSERMVNAPDRTQQTHKRCRCTNGGEQGLTPLQLDGCLTQSLTQAAQQSLPLRRALCQRALRSHCALPQGIGHGLHQPLSIQRLDLRHRLDQIGHLPERSHGLRHASARYGHKPELVEDDHPAEH